MKEIVLCVLLATVLIQAVGSDTPTKSPEKSTTTAKALVRPANNYPVRPGTPTKSPEESTTTAKALVKPANNYPVRPGTPTKSPEKETTTTTTAKPLVRPANNYPVGSDTPTKSPEKETTTTTTKPLVKPVNNYPVRPGTPTKSPEKETTTTTTKSLVKPVNNYPVKPPKSSGFRCHVCETPVRCKEHHEKDCPKGQDTCTRIHRPIVDDSGTANKHNYYAATTKGIMVWGRGCTTMQKCEKEKEMKKKLNMTVECCQEPLCNP